MAGPGTTFQGPLQTGTQKDATATAPSNLGLVLLTQVASIAINAGSAVSATFTIPAGSVISDFKVDVTTAFNAGTNNNLTIGTAAAGTQYLSATALTAAGRTALTFTGAQLTAMSGVGSNTSVVATYTPSGTNPTTGAATITLYYIQTVQLTTGSA
jgi:hypothetical protein